MISRLWAVALAFCALLAKASVVFDNIVVPVPPGWSPEERNGVLYMSPDELSTGVFIVLIMREVKPQEALETHLEHWWQAFAGSGVAAGPQRNERIITRSGATGLLRSGLIQERDARRFNTVIALDWGNRYRVISSTADSEATDLEYRSKFAAIVSGLQSQMNAPASAGHAATALRPAYELLLTVAALPGRSPSTYIYCLFPDGTWIATVPPEGLNNFDVPGNKRVRPSDFGTWTRNNDVLTLRTAYRFETLYRQSDGSYVRKDREARYVREGQTDGPSITFQADGTFRDDGAVRTLDAGEIGVRFRDIAEVLGPGSATYEIANNTLSLSYADGRIKPMVFILTPQLAAQRNPQAIHIAKVWFKRT